MSRFEHLYIPSGNISGLLCNKSLELARLSSHQVATPRDDGGWLEPTIKPKATWSWWGKFPAPPADRKTDSLYLKVGPPIDDIPIMDKP